MKAGGLQSFDALLQILIAARAGRPPEVFEHVVGAELDVITEALQALVVHQLQEDIFVLLAELFAGVEQFDVAQSCNALSLEVTTLIAMSDREECGAHEVIGNAATFLAPEWQLAFLERRRLAAASLGLRSSWWMQDDRAGGL